MNKDIYANLAFQLVQEPTSDTKNSGSLFRELTMTYYRWTQSGSHVMEKTMYISEGLEKLAKTGNVKRNQYVAEHKVPNKILFEMAKETKTLDEFIDLLDDQLFIAHITKEEDQLLKDAGLNSKLPESGLDRYAEVGITILPQPIVRKDYGLQ